MFAGTAWLFSDQALNQKLDYLFIDEAGQVSIANTLAMCTSTKNIILIGDQMQLSQPIKGIHPGISSKSSLEYLLEGYDTIPPEKGIFLNRTRRLNKNICDFVSSSFYDSRLKTHPVTNERYVKLDLDQINNEGIIYIPMSHENNAQKSNEESDYIKSLLEKIIGKKCKDNKKSYIINPNRFNFLEHFDKTPSVKLKMKKYFSQARFNYFNTDIIKTESLGNINIVTNKVVGNEQPKKTGVLSDKMMSTLAIVYKELGFDTVTAGTATNSADIQFRDLTKIARQLNINNPAEEIEVKAGVMKDDNATFYGGPDMKKHIKAYLLAMFNKDHSKAFMFLTDINGPLVVKTGTKDKTTMDFKTILKYHKDDIRPIYGSLDNNNEIIMEDIRREVK